MCNLQEHSARDHRIHEAQRLEPVYTKLAAEYGIEYQPPALHDHRDGAICHTCATYNRD